MTIANLDIKFEAARNEVKLFEIAKKLGIAESTFYRHLRFPLEEAEHQKMLEAIREIAAARSTQ